MNCNRYRTKVSLIIFLSVIIGFGMFSCDKKNNEYQPVDKITFPCKNTRLIAGATYTLRYNFHEGETINIKLYQNNQLAQIIQSNTPNNGSYAWSVPENLDYDTTYSIEIVDTEDTNNILTNINNFTILQKPETDSIIDERDGRIYRIIKIGHQWWFAQNFAYKAENESFCYSYQNGNCEEYGRLYTRDGAMNSALPGWHLPSDNEWEELLDYYGMGSLEGCNHYYPTNYFTEAGGSGFDILYGGYMNGCVNAFGHIHYENHFWSSTLTNEDNPVVFIFSKEDPIPQQLGTICHKGCYVRYVKD